MPVCGTRSLRRTSNAEATLNETADKSSVTHGHRAMLGGIEVRAVPEGGVWNRKPHLLFLRHAVSALIMVFVAGLFYPSTTQIKKRTVEKDLGAQTLCS